MEKAITARLRSSFAEVSFESLLKAKDLVMAFIFDQDDINTGVASWFWLASLVAPPLKKHRTFWPGCLAFFEGLIVVMQMLIWCLYCGHEEFCLCVSSDPAREGLGEVRSHWGGFIVGFDRWTGRECVG